MAALHHCGERPGDRVRLRTDAEPVVFAVRRRALRGLAVGIGVAPSLLGLRRMLGRIVVSEDVEHLIGCQPDAHRVCLPGFLDGSKQLDQALGPLGQQRVLA
jgi:hypothetical protein